MPAKQDSNAHHGAVISINIEAAGYKPEHVGITHEEGTGYTEPGKVIEGEFVKRPLEREPSET